jgi:hypothetical protein
MSNSKEKYTTDMTIQTKVDCASTYNYDLNDIKGKWTHLAKHTQKTICDSPHFKILSKDDI